MLNPCPQTDKRELYLRFSKTFCVFTFFLLTTLSSFAQRNLIYAVNNGYWNQNATWNLGRVPGSSDSIIVPIGKTVTISSNVSLTNSVIEVFGTLLIDEPATSGGKTYLDLATTTTNSMTYVIRVNKSTSRLGRGSDNMGMGFIRIKVNNKGDFITKYTTSAIDVKGPAYALNNGDGGFDMNGVSSLPVILVDFVAYHNGKAVILKWKSPQENNSDRYTVERSVDGRTWLKQGDVTAIQFSTMPQFYSFTDESPVPGIAYYRLKIVDRDGKFGITPIKAVRATGTGLTNKLSLYPNPAFSNATLIVNQEKQERFDIFIFNKHGQLVARHQSSEGSNIVSFPVNHLPIGEYTIDVKSKSGTRQTVRMSVGN